MTPNAATVPARSRGGRTFVLVCLVLLALNLRAAVGSVGVVLNTISSDLGMSATVGGIVATLPVVCFALVGVMTNVVVRRIGLHGTAVAALALVAIGLGSRSVVQDTLWFVVASTVALAGCALGNVILPPLVKLHFPDRISSVSAVYGAALMAGAAISSGVTVPIADTFGGWRVGLATWAALALVTLLPWLAMLGQGTPAGPEDEPAITIRTVARSPLAWAMVLFFAAQSAQAYAQFGWLPAILTDAGLSDSYAGFVQGLVPAIGIPLTLTLPWLFARFGDRPILPWMFSVLTISGWVGVLLRPTVVPWLWAALLGIGGAAFTWVLTMLGRRTRSPEGTAALSSFVQGLGYLLSSIGPLGTGVVHDLTGSWTPPILGLIVLALMLGVLGTYISRPQMFEDTLGAPR